MTPEEKFRELAKMGQYNNVAIMSSGKDFHVGEVNGHHFINIGQPKPTIEEAIDDAVYRARRERLREEHRKKRRKKK